MNRSWPIWCVLLGCSAIILGAFAWMTQHALSTEKERAVIEAESQRAERMRLALARMDTIGTDLLVVENQRPPLHYDAFYAPEGVLTNQLQSVEQGIVLQPSPLLLEKGELVQMHFEVDANGGCTSPQLPFGNERELAINSGVTHEDLKFAESRLEKVCKLLPESLKLASFFSQPELVASKSKELDESAAWISDNARDIVTNGSVLKQEYQQKLSTVEKGSRVGAFNEAVRKAKKRSVGNSIKAQQIESPERLVKLSSLLPVWIGEELLLLRQVRMTRSVRYQGAWLNREQVEAALMAEIPEDLKSSRLVAVATPEEQSSDPMALASLPWKLEAGPFPPLAMPRLTPLRTTLIAGWVAAFLALGALFLLLRGVMKLSERRAAFVSSVTHELRTPLTTFRLYSEMLADGMVTDEKKREDYLRTMLSESERLNHLVENVLAYSQIERGNARSKFERLGVKDLVERLRPVLQRRVDQEEAALSINVDDEVGEVETDVTAVEQILFNLIDNACKYGLPEQGHGHITLQVKRAAKGLVFQVSDEGRGIASHERKRLFRAFHKSAHDAAHDKPGVGLGLALCRRLAKALGGDLILDRQLNKGASFSLVLR